MTIQNMQRQFVHIESYCPIVLLVSTSSNTLASLCNGLSMALPLQTHVQGVGVHLMSHSETGDLGGLNCPGGGGGGVCEMKAIHGVKKNGELLPPNCTQGTTSEVFD